MYKTKLVMLPNTKGVYLPVSHPSYKKLQNPNNKMSVDGMTTKRHMKLLREQRKRQQRK
jgi:hypothetical protein